MLIYFGPVGEVEEAEVKWFDSRKGYGFLQKDGKDIYFGYSDGQNIRSKDGALQWCSFFDGQRMRSDIRPGDVIVFERIYNGGGSTSGCKAVRWTLKGTYGYAQKCLQQQLRTAANQ